MLAGLEESGVEDLLALVACSLVDLDPQGMPSLRLASGSAQLPVWATGLGVMVGRFECSLVLSLWLCYESTGGLFQHIRNQ